MRSRHDRPQPQTGFSAAGGGNAAAPPRVVMAVNEFIRGFCIKLILLGTVPAEEGLRELSEAHDHDFRPEVTAVFGD